VASTLSDDFEYEVPVRYSSNEDVEKEFSSKEYLIKGGKDYFRATFERLKDSYGWAAKQRSRTRRYVTNVHISEVKKGDGEVIVNVRSNVLLIRTERDSPSHWTLSAVRRDVLRVDEEKVMLRKRVTLLDYVDVPMYNIYFPI